MQPPRGSYFTHFGVPSIPASGWLNHIFLVADHTDAVRREHELYQVVLGAIGRGRRGQLAVATVLRCSASDAATIAATAAVVVELNRPATARTTRPPTTAAAVGARRLSGRKRAHIIGWRPCNGDRACAGAGAIGWRQRAICVRFGVFFVR